MRIPSSSAVHVLRLQCRSVVSAPEMDRESKEENDSAMLASAALRQMFGPHAKIVVQPVVHRRGKRIRRMKEDGESNAVKSCQHEDNGYHNADPSNSAAGSSLTSDPTHSYRASSTFKLLGFMIELASVEAVDERAAVEGCLAQSLQSDIPFIHPRQRAQPERRGSHESSMRVPSEDNGWGGQAGGERRLNHHQPPAVPYLSPHEAELKAIIDELRDLCVRLSRRLKFSIKSHENAHARDEHALSTAAGATLPAAPYHCRAYEKDAWSTVARASLAVEVPGDSPRSALLHALVQLREKFQKELRDPELLKACTVELQSLLHPFGKHVEACVREEKEKSDGTNERTNSRASETMDEVPAASSSAPSAPASTAGSLLPPLTSYTASISIVDAYGNQAVDQTTRQRSPVRAIELAAQESLKREHDWVTVTTLQSSFTSSPSPTSAAPPLLARIRWQVELLAASIAQSLGGAEGNQSGADVVNVRVMAQQKESSEEKGSKEQEKSTHGAATASSGHGISSGSSPRREVLYTATVTAAGGSTMLFMASGGGRYRLTLDAYLIALRFLMEHYEDSCVFILQHQQKARDYSGWLFASRQELEAAVAAHDAFSVLAHHKSNWNCFAVLGTITSSLMGGYFQMEYEPSTGADRLWWATLRVHTGVCSNEILIQSSGKTKTEASTRACLDVLRQNFPRQHTEVVREHPDVDLSCDTLAKSSKYRSLPREKRVEHIQNLLSMVFAFGEEDLGWFQPRIKYRNTSSELGFPQWIAELEATVEENEVRQVVATSPPFPTVRIAKRVLIWRLAEQYFPKELEYYRSLRRSDGSDPTLDHIALQNKREYKLFRPNTDEAFIAQLFRLMARNNTTLAPFSWTLTGVNVGGSSTGMVEGEDGSHSHGILVPEPHESMLLHGAAAYLGDAETPRRLLQPLCLRYEATVLGSDGDLIVADYKGKLISTAEPSNFESPEDARQMASAPPDGQYPASSGGGGGGGELVREESPIEVLLAALKTASHHLHRADSETMWTEFTTHDPPSFPTTREMCLYLFYTLFGNYHRSSLVDAAGSSSVKTQQREKGGSGSSSSGEKGEKGTVNRSEEEAIEAVPLEMSISAIDIHAVKVGAHWVGTASLPIAGFLPVARAYHSSKRVCIKDALTLATRQCFGDVLRYWAKHCTAVSSMAEEVLTEPILYALPEGQRRDALKRVRLEKNKPHPFVLLLRYLDRQFAGVRQIRVDRSMAVGKEHQCRLYLQPHARLTQKGMTQLVGFGAARSPEEALHTAACMALDNLYDEKYEAK